MEDSPRRRCTTANEHTAPAPCRSPSSVVPKDPVHQSPTGSPAGGFRFIGRDINGCPVYELRLDEEDRSVQPMTTDALSMDPRTERLVTTRSSTMQKPPRPQFEDGHKGCRLHCVPPRALTRVCASVDDDHAQSSVNQGPTELVGRRPLEGGEGVDGCQGDADPQSLCLDGGDDSGEKGLRSLAQGKWKAARLRRCLRSRPQRQRRPRTTRRFNQAADREPLRCAVEELVKAFLADDAAAIPQAPVPAPAPAPAAESSRVVVRLEGPRLSLLAGVEISIHSGAQGYTDINVTLKEKRHLNNYHQSNGNGGRESGRSGGVTTQTPISAAEYERELDKMAQGLRALLAICILLVIGVCVFFAKI